MEGHTRIETFDFIGDDPATAPILKKMIRTNGKPVICDNVWISYFTGGPKEPDKESGEGFGKLTGGYGARGGNFKEIGAKIGPGFTFGIYMQKHVKQVLADPKRIYPAYDADAGL